MSDPSPYAIIQTSDPADDPQVEVEYAETMDDAVNQAAQLEGDVRIYVNVHDVGLYLKELQGRLRQVEERRYFEKV